MRHLKFAFFSFLLVSFCSLQGADFYQIHQLAPDAKASFATDINQNGQVCGTIKPGNKKSTQLFIWDAITGLKINAIEPLSSPVINNQAQVGTTVLDKGWFWKGFKGLVWDSVQDNVSVYFPNAVVRDIADDGSVLLMDKFAKISKENPNAKLSLFQNGEYLTQPLEQLQQIDKLNQHSQVLGTIIQKDQNQMACPTLINLKTGISDNLIFDDNAYGYDVNDKGQVVGQFFDPVQKHWKGFCWDPVDGLTLLEDFLPYAMNNMGQIIGLDAQQNPAIWENGDIKNLNAISKQAPGDLWQSLIRVTGINDRGQIIGWGLVGSDHQAFILNPMEPDASSHESSPLEALDKPIEIDESSFNAVVSEGVVLVSFYATWCGHCKLMKPVLEAYAKEMQGKVLVAKAEGSVIGKHISTYNVRAAPTSILFKNGKEVKRVEGYVSLETFKRLLEPAL